MLRLRILNQRSNVGIDYALSESGILYRTNIPCWSLSTSGVLRIKTLSSSELREIHVAIAELQAADKRPEPPRYCSDIIIMEGWGVKIETNLDFMLDLPDGFRRIYNTFTQFLIGEMGRTELPEYDISPKDCFQNDVTGKANIPIIGDVAKAERDSQKRARGRSDRYLPLGRNSLVATGMEHTCAISRTGKTYCWGNNYSSALGSGDAMPPDEYLEIVQPDGGPYYRERPHPVMLPNRAKMISSDGYYTCVLLLDGTIRCWGALSRLSPRIDSPVAVGNLVEAKTISVGGTHACAVLPSGAVSCWGYNDSGQLGIGYVSRIDDDPILDMSETVVGLKDVLAVSCGSRASCAITPDREVYCWGIIDYRDSVVPELGQSGNLISSLPVKIPYVNDVVRVAVGTRSACALGGDGKVICWGASDSEILNPSSIAERIHFSFGRPSLGFDAIDVSLSEHIACAVSLRGNVQCWGDQDVLAELGAYHSIGPDPGTTLSVSLYHICASKGQGNVYCWGRNGSGQLGTGDRVDRRDATVVRLPPVPSKGD